jgi:LAO/AO transport system kinase
VILETVGVGQSELEVAAVADTTVVVLTPNLGDGVQMIKAGILEIADIFVVNKADLEGHQRVAMELRGMLSLSAPRALGGGAQKAWKPPIIPTVAARQEGIRELWAAVEAHRHYLETSGQARELAEKRLKDETAEVVAELAGQQARLALGEDAGLTKKLLKDGTPYRAAEEILSRIGRAPAKRRGSPDR